MKRSCIYKSILISIFAIGLICFFFSTNKVHRPINTIDVQSITVWGHTRRVVNNDEKQEIIKWFNSINNIRKNKDFAGTTPEAGVIIELKTGERILILQSGIDFEIQRTNSSGKFISYWGKQSNIRNLLETARESSVVNLSY